MSSPSSRLIDQVNSVIQTFNARDYRSRDCGTTSERDQDAIGKTLGEILVLSQDPEITPLEILGVLDPLRAIACEINSTESMLEIDRILQHYMAAGIPQMGMERDRQFRALANEIVALSNGGDVQAAIEHLQQWNVMCATEPVVSYVQEDCFPPPARHCQGNR